MSGAESNIPIAKLSEAWVNQGMNNKQIEEKLLFNGYDQRYINDLLAEISKMRNAKKTAKGLWLILFGAVLCLLSCILTLTHVFAGNDVSFILFGLTSVGILLVFGGLVYIFG